MKNLSIKEKSESELRIFSISPENIIEKFLSSLDIKPNSKETYSRGLKRFFLWIAGYSVINPGREDILAYKNFLEGEGLSSLTVSNYIVVVRRLFEWLEGMKLYPNIAKGVKGAKQPKGFHKDTLTVSQIHEVLRSVDKSTLQGKRDFALLNLLIRTGLRTIEIVRANVEDLRQEGREAILYIQGKGRESKDDFVLLTEETLIPIREYLTARKSLGDDPLFASLSTRNPGARLATRTIRGLVKHYLRKCNLESERLSAHSFRHTAITLALKAGASIQEAQALARHSQITTTMVYAQNLNRIGSAAERKIASLLASPN